jgi:hypothetical protein
MEIKSTKIPIETKMPPIWSTTKLYSAIDWWKRNGNFNKDLYEKLVEIKYQIEVK